jgi:hypothetical protein
VSQPTPFNPDYLLTKEECHKKAQEQLRLAEDKSGEWGMSHALTAIGYLWLGDAQPEVREYRPRAPRIPTTRGK